MDIKNGICYTYNISLGNLALLTVTIHVRRYKYFRKGEVEAVADPVKINLESLLSLTNIFSFEILL